MVMDLIVDLYWSFRSPYSYIVLPRIIELRDKFRVSVDLKIVHPAAIRNPSYFERMDPLARPDFMKDSARAAAFHGLKFRRPVPDPIEQDPNTLAIGKGAAPRSMPRSPRHSGQRAGAGLEFSREVSSLLWDGSVSGWDKDTHLAEASARAGLDLSELESAIVADPERHEARLDENDRALRAAGHWGVPVMVYEGEPFFGQDRFDMLVWRLKQRGLEQRLDSGVH
jgi:2-hydroxychromene-2-carboxylate isomerase